MLTMRGTQSPTYDNTKLFEGCYQIMYIITRGSDRDKSPRIYDIITTNFTSKSHRSLLRE